MYAKMSALLADLHREFGWKSRLFSALGSRYVLWKIRREEKRLAAGWTYEPPTFYEKNDACADLAGAARCRYVTTRLAPRQGGPTAREATPAADCLLNT